MVKIMTLDCALKNCGWSLLEKKDGEVNVLDFGLLDFSAKPLCKVCSEPSIGFNFDDCEPIYCCKGHMKELNCQKIKKLSSQDICKNLINKLNELHFIDGVDDIIIENQPSFQNAISKAIQCYLLSYFTFKNKNVILQNPNQKLFGYSFKDSKKKYKERKLLATYLIKNTLKKNDINKLLKYSKVDDICDSLLMGYYHFSSGIKQIKENMIKLQEEYTKTKLKK